LIAAQASAIAALSFVVAVVSSTAVIAANHPDAPAFPSGSSANEVRLILGASFLIGLLSLLASIGASGWAHSRHVGWTTTLLSIAAFAIISVVIA
jgi:hypothetical protein